MEGFEPIGFSKANFSPFLFKIPIMLIARLVDLCLGQVQVEGQTKSETNIVTLAGRKEKGGSDWYSPLFARQIRFSHTRK